MWFASFILTPVAFFVLRAAANDSPIFNKDAWIKRIKFRKK
jgi:hypothetical protein